MAFTQKIHFPNGMGYTPCTEEYYLKHVASRAIKAKYGAGDPSMEIFSSEDYETFNRLGDEMASMSMNGHLGKSVRY